MIKYSKECTRCWIYLSQNEELQNKWCVNCGYQLNHPMYPTYDKNRIPAYIFIEAFTYWMKNANGVEAKPKGSYAQSYLINANMCHIHSSKYHGKNNEKYWYGVLMKAPSDLWIFDRNFLILINDYDACDSYIINFDDFIVMLEDVWTEDKDNKFQFTIDMYDRIRKRKKYYLLQEFKNAYHQIGLTPPEYCKDNAG